MGDNSSWSGGRHGLPRESGIATPDRNASAPTGWIGPYLQRANRLRTEENGYQWVDRVAELARTPWHVAVDAARVWPQPAIYATYRFTDPQPGVDISDLPAPPLDQEWQLDALPSDEEIEAIMAAQAPFVAAVQARLDAATAARR